MTTKLQVVLPPKGDAYPLASWLGRMILEITANFEATRWDYPVAEDASVVIFFASQIGGGQPNLWPIRRAVSWGRTIIVVTGDEGTVSPMDIGPVEIGKIYFYHTEKPEFGGEGEFISLDRLKMILREALLDIPLAASPLTATALDAGEE